MFIKIAMLVVFFGTMIGIGLYCRKHSTDVNGFVLGGRSVGPWLTAFAYGTSYFSAVVFVGYAGQFGWKYGIAATWAGIGNAIIGSLLAWIILGRRTRIMTQHLDSATMPQFFSSRYNSQGLKLLSSAVIFIFLIPYTASLYNGLSRLFGMAFDIPYEACVIVMSILTAIYVIAGGYMATAINDFIQGIVMIVGIIAVIIAVLSTQGGLTAAMDSLSRISSGAEGIKQGALTSFFGPDPINLAGVVLLTSLGTWGLPQMVQKFYAIKNEKAITKGTIISTIFALIVAGGCYFLGGFGRLFTPDTTADGAVIFDSIVPNMLKGLPDVLIGVVIVLVLSASMSTLSSLVLTSSSTLTLDFIKEKIHRNMNEKRQVFVMRVLIVVFIVISSIIAIVQHQGSVSFIAQLMGVSWGALAGAFLAPFLYGLYWKGVTKAAVWVNILFSTVVMIANMVVRNVFPTILQSPINSGAFCMLAGLVIVPVVSGFTKKPDEKMIEDVFSCYAQSVTVSVKEHMG
ncbi:MAG: sodium:solute symporter family protein [Clostridia bacterium]|nr:sodium:solute symporter family protein [Clostridia bacterium]